LRAVGEPLVAMRFLPCPRALLLFSAVWIAGSRCDASLLDALVPRAPERRSAVAPETQGDLQQRQIAFLNRLRKADPEHRTIERAVFNERNELGLLLNRGVELDKIPALMRTMLTQMGRAFPGQDLTVLAYAPSNPPRKLGTARLNARARDMTYTPER
jgi:hypothetical protein